MDNNTIESLREALKVSPNNIPLKLHLANILVHAERLDEAEKEFSELITLTDDAESKTGLANVFYLKGEYSKCNVILETLIHNENNDFDTLILYAKALIKEKSLEKAKVFMHWHYRKIQGSEMKNWTMNCGLVHRVLKTS